MNDGLETSNNDGKVSDSGNLTFLSPTTSQLIHIKCDSKST